MLFVLDWYFPFCMCSVGLLSCIRNLQKTHLWWLWLPSSGALCHFVLLEDAPVEKQMTKNALPSSWLVALHSHLPPVLPRRRTWFKTQNPPHAWNWMEKFSVCLHETTSDYSQKLLVCRSRDFTIELEVWLNFSNLCEIVKSFFFSWVHANCRARENSACIKCGLDVNVQHMFDYFPIWKMV